MDGFDISTLFKTGSCSHCLICGEIVEEYEEMRPAVPIICEECKRAVAWARKKSGKRKKCEKMTERSNA